MQMATSIEGDNGEMIVKRVSVPIGLEELMEGLTKEVILKKPKDICVFASEYFSNLLNLREKGTLKVGAGKRVQSVTKIATDKSNLKYTSKSFDTGKSLIRQKNIRSNSSTEKTLSTKKIVLTSKDDKNEKTKSFLDKRKARRSSKDETSKPQLDRKDKRTPRSTSRTKDETKTSQAESKSSKSSARSNATPRNKDSKTETSLVKDLAISSITKVSSNVKTGCVLEETGAADLIAECHQREIPADVELLENLKSVDEVDLSKSDAVDGATQKNDPLDENYAELDETEKNTNQVNSAKNSLKDTTHESMEIAETILAGVRTQKAEEDSEVTKPEALGVEEENTSNKLATDSENTNQDAIASLGDIKQSVKESDVKIKSDADSTSDDKTTVPENIGVEKKADSAVSPSEKMSLEKQIEANDGSTELVTDKENANVLVETQADLQNVENEIEAEDSLPESIQHDSENKENIDLNQKADVTKQPTVKEILTRDKNLKNKNMRTKSVEHIRVKEADRTKEQPKIKRVKSVDLTKKELKRSVSKSKIASEIQNETAKRSKRSASTEAVETKSFVSSKLRAEIQEASELTKTNNFNSSYNPYKLKQEIKEASQAADKIAAIMGPLAAAIKIQSIWRGFVGRKQVKEMKKVLVRQNKVTESQGEAFIERSNKELEESDVEKRAESPADLNEKKSDDDQQITISNEEKTVGKSNEEITAGALGKKSEETQVKELNRELEEKLESQIEEEERKASETTQEEDSKKNDIFKEAINETALNDKKISKFSMKREVTNSEVDEEISRKLISPLNAETAVKNNSTKTESENHDLKRSETSKAKTLDMGDAVLRIQAVWRGFRVRKQLEHKDYFGAAVKKEIKVKENLELVKKLAKEKAVSKIQAFWRGYKVRKNIKDVRKRLAELQKPAECDEMSSQRQLSDDDIFKAAAKIQAGVRGYIVRKRKFNTCTLNSINEEPASPEDENILNSLPDVPTSSPEIHATKNIQESDHEQLTVKNIKEATNDLNLMENKVEELKSETNIPENLQTGNETKNTIPIDVNKDNKKTEIKLISSELDSSITNKLEGSETSLLIDKSINKEIDLISATQDEPGYEDAPTRPVTSDTIQECENKQSDVESEKIDTDTNKQEDNWKTPTQTNLKQINEMKQDEKKLILASQESTTSVDSIVTVINNERETPLGSFEKEMALADSNEVELDREEKISSKPTSTEAKESGGIVEQPVQDQGVKEEKISSKSTSGEAIEIDSEEMEEKSNKEETVTDNALQCQDAKEAKISSKPTSEETSKIDLEEIEEKANKEETVSDNAIQSQDAKKEKISSKPTSEEKIKIDSEEIEEKSNKEETVSNNAVQCQQDNQEKISSKPTSQKTTKINSEEIEEKSNKEGTVTDNALQCQDAKEAKISSKLTSEETIKIDSEDIEEKANKEETVSNNAVHCPDAKEAKISSKPTSEETIKINSEEIEEKANKEETVSNNAVHCQEDNQEKISSKPTSQKTIKINSEEIEEKSNKEGTVSDNALQCQDAKEANISSKPTSEETIKIDSEEIEEKSDKTEPVSDSILQCQDDGQKKISSKPTSREEAIELETDSREIEEKSEKGGTVGENTAQAQSDNKEKISSKPSSEEAIKKETKQIDLREIEEIAQTQKISSKPTSGDALEIGQSDTADREEKISSKPTSEEAIETKPMKKIGLYEKEEQFEKEKTISDTASQVQGSLENIELLNKNLNETPLETGKNLNEAVKENITASVQSADNNLISQINIINEIGNDSKLVEAKSTQSEEHPESQQDESSLSISDSDNNKLNRENLQNEIANSHKKLQDLAKGSSEETNLSSSTDRSESLKTPEMNPQLLDQTNNKLNKETLEAEIVNFSKSLSAQNSEEDTETSTSNLSEEKDEEQTSKDLLRIHIPLSELSEIKEEETDSRSVTESLDDLNDEAKKEKSEAERRDESVEEKSLKRQIDDEESKVALFDQVEKHVREKSADSSVSLVHSGEFHDSVTAPILITPPSTASDKQEKRLDSPQGLVNTGELHDNVLPVSVQLNEAPPGVKILTSYVSESINNDGQDRAQASNKDASTYETQSDNTKLPTVGMETEKRNNATTMPKKNMEAEAATKIQAGFRGYQVRKQLKNKISSPGDISNQRRSARRKSSGKVTESGRIVSTKIKQPSDIEEKSAVKIQAGVRGFLVRRRQKKQKQGKESS